MDAVFLLIVIVLFICLIIACVVYHESFYESFEKALEQRWQAQLKLYKVLKNQKRNMRRQRARTLKQQAYRFLEGGSGLRVDTMPSSATEPKELHEETEEEEGGRVHREDSPFWSSTVDHA
jgi:hypothetical protein